MTEKKKNYLSPHMEVVKVQQTHIICASPYGTKSMYEEELDSECFQEL